MYAVSQTNAKRREGKKAKFEYGTVTFILNAFFPFTIIIGPCII